MTFKWVLESDKDNVNVKKKWYENAQLNTQYGLIKKQPTIDMVIIVLMDRMQEMSRAEKVN